MTTCRGSAIRADRARRRLYHRQPGQIAKLAGAEEAVLEHQLSPAKQADIAEPQEVGELRAVIHTQPRGEAMQERLGLPLRNLKAPRHAAAKKRVAKAAHYVPHVVPRRAERVPPMLPIKDRRRGQRLYSAKRRGDQRQPPVVHGRRSGGDRAGQPRQRAADRRRTAGHHVLHQ